MNTNLIGKFLVIKTTLEPSGEVKTTEPLEIVSASMSEGYQPVFIVLNSKGQLLRRPINLDPGSNKQYFILPTPQTGVYR